MDNVAIGRHSLRFRPGLLAGQGLALLLWVAVVVLAYAAWRRRRGDDATDLVIVGGFWLAVRLGLLVAGLSGSGQPGDDWLVAALDLAGLVLLAWPFLAPPLPTRWADRLAGIGLLAVVLACGMSLWQRVRGALGLSPTLRFAITWAHSTLVLAALAAFNLLHVRTRRWAWLTTVVGAFSAGISGLVIPPPVASPSSSILTAAAATIAALWLNWLDYPPRKAAPATPGSAVCLDPWPASQLLEATSSLFTATDLAQLLKTATAALTQVLEVRLTALLLTQDESAEYGEKLRLRLVARWPPADGRETFPPIPPALGPILADALRRGHTFNLIHAVDERRLQALEAILGGNLEAALILPLLSPPLQRGLEMGQGLLVVGHDGPPLSASQLHLCCILADQVAIITHCIQLRAKIGQQSRALTRLVRRQEQEAGRFRAILEGIADGIIVSDANDQVILANNAALDTLGMERSDVLGTPFGQIMNSMVPAGEVGIVRTLAEDSPYGMQAVFEVSNRVVQTSMATFQNDEGNQLGVVAMLRDITGLSSAEVERERLLSGLEEHSRQLEEAAEQLRELDRLKSQLLANMSHELRTPLNSIIGFSGVMLKEIDGQLTETQREDMEAIHTSGKHLLGLVTDMLDISQIWAGKMDLTLSDVGVPKMVDDAITIAAPLIGDRSIKLVQALDPDLPAIRADKTRARQVLLNLLTNAIKYTEQGHIIVSASRDQDTVVISVADTGIGIPPEHIETIFEEFCRVANFRTRKVSGLGLGLAISRKLVELQGGQIWVESEVGVGSTFYFSLPIEGPPSTSMDRKITHQRLEAALARWQ
jgi:PAS domain S-box-containing protein